MLRISSGIPTKQAAGFLSGTGGSDFGSIVTSRLASLTSLVISSLKTVTEISGVNNMNLKSVKMTENRLLPIAAVCEVDSSVGDTSSDEGCGVLVSVLVSHVGSELEAWELFWVRDLSVIMIVSAKESLPMIGVCCMGT